VEIRDYRGAWQGACRRAGLTGRIPHDFRRTAVRNLERSGVPRSVAMKLTGHKTESVYRRYAIVAQADLVEGVKKLAALHATEGTSVRTVVPFSGRTGTELTQSAAVNR
jgi:integrase